MIVLFGIIILYALCLIYFAYGFLKCRSLSVGNESPFTKVSIVVCARNEAEHTEKCLSGICTQNYPKHLMEIIFIDDASSDKTLTIASQCLLNNEVAHQIIANPNQLGKKKSLSTGIALTSNELIISRDADTFTESDLWLKSVVDFQNQTQSDFVIAPLALSTKTGLLWALQAVENNVLQVLSAGSNYFNQSFLCSGANMAFTKSIYEACHGYASHLHIASGDDVLFLEDVKKIPGARINYLKSNQALVYTYATKTYTELLHQKVRWASKFKYNANKLNLALGLLSFLANASCLIAMIKIFLHQSLFPVAIGIVLIKLCVDFLILFVASRLIKSKHLMGYALPALCIYPIYACIIALASLQMKPHWKK